MSSALKLAVEELAGVIPQLTERDRAFATSLVSNWRLKGLSVKQAGWVETLIARATNPAPAAVQIGSALRIVTMLTTAAKHLKHPAILVRVDGRDMRLSMAGPQSKAPGTVQVCSIERGFANRTWYGRVRQDGTFEPSQRVDATTQTAIAAALTALATDPEGAAAAYGKLTGVCCFCNHSLGHGDDQRSVAVGYGPVCAEHFGLSWGTKIRK